MTNYKNQSLISVKSFSQEELRKWQMKLLEILVYFKEFCDLHDLQFFLAAGTCIGAVRHHGFIPWDDDLDVVMLRKDYDKLIKLWDKEADNNRFQLCVTNKDKSSRFPMATIRSVNTTCIYQHSINDDICQGLKIDVRFLDGVPPKKIPYLFQYFCEGLFGLLRTERAPERMSRKRRIVAKIILVVFPKHSIRWRVSCWCEEYMKKYLIDNCEYVRYLLCSPLPKRIFTESINVDFEGYNMPIPQDYDLFLKYSYGDYMQYPSLEQRLPATDNLVFYDLNNSYLNYKGKYYCIKK